MSFPDKNQRIKCWTAKDNFWKCLDESESKEIGAKKCANLRNLYEQDCPGEWVKHFDRKYDFLKYKEKIEKHGIEYFDDKED